VSNPELRYRIQAVAELTGVSAPTLRSWERRYGVPVPQRTASAYRLYSDADVELVKRMRELVDSGVPASEAARRVTVTAVPSYVEAEVLDPYEGAVARILEAIESFQAENIEAAVRLALTLGPAATVFERVFRPALARTGELWEAGRLGVAQEHLASQIIETAVRNTLRLVQPPDATRSVLLACFASEQHVLPLYGIGLRFAGWSYRVTLLGARTPPEALAQAVARLRPDVVGLSCTFPIAREQARKLLEGYGRACGSTLWVVGGQQAPDLAELVSAAGGLCFTSPDAGSLRASLDRGLKLRHLA
jgi:DNA-binding transcriptional MerR regulator